MGSWLIAYKSLLVELSLLGSPSGLANERHHHDRYVMFSQALLFYHTTIFLFAGDSSMVSSNDSKVKLRNPKVPMLGSLSPYCCQRTLQHDWWTGDARDWKSITVTKSKQQQQQQRVGFVLLYCYSPRYRLDSAVWFYMTQSWEKYKYKVTYSSFHRLLCVR